MSKGDSNIELTTEEKDELIGLIKDFFKEEKDEEIGDLQASIILNFVTDKLSHTFYNKGIYDAYTYINDRNSDLLGLQK